MLLHSIGCGEPSVDQFLNQDNIYGGLSIGRLAFSYSATSFHNAGLLHVGDNGIFTRRQALDSNPRPQDSVTCEWSTSQLLNQWQLCQGFYLFFWEHRANQMAELTLQHQIKAGLSQQGQFSSQYPKEPSGFYTPKQRFCFSCHTLWRRVGEKQENAVRDKK